jgi:hypothetical protein
MTSMREHNEFPVLRVFHGKPLDQVSLHLPVYCVLLRGGPYSGWNGPFASKYSIALIALS